jgi:hypothetical protein
MKHSPREGMGIEDKAHLTDAIYKRNDDYIRFAYSYMRNKDCGCK